MRVLADGYPVARKQHYCSDCGRCIERGEKYRRVDYVGDDGLYVWKSCAHCDKVSAAIWSLPDMHYFSDEGIDVLEWLTEYGIEPLASQMRDHWHGVTPDQIDVSKVTA